MANDTDLPYSDPEGRDEGFDDRDPYRANAPPARFGRLALCTAAAGALAFGVLGTVAYSVWFNHDQQAYAEAIATARQALGIRGPAAASVSARQPAPQAVMAATTQAAAAAAADPSARATAAIPGAPATVTPHGAATANALTNTTSSEEIAAAAGSRRGRQAGGLGGPGGASPGGIGNDARRRRTYRQHSGRHHACRHHTRRQHPPEPGNPANTRTFASPQQPARNERRSRRAAVRRKPNRQRRTDRATGAQWLGGEGDAAHEQSVRADGAVLPTRELSAT